MTANQSVPTGDDAVPTALVVGVTGHFACVPLDPAIRMRAVNVHRDGIHGPIYLMNGDEPPTLLPLWPGADSISDFFTGETLWRKAEPEGREP